VEGVGPAQGLIEVSLALATDFRKLAAWSAPGELSMKMS
jgi:hypothetical protein